MDYSARGSHSRNVDPIYEMRIPFVRSISHTGDLAREEEENPRIIARE